MQIATFEPNYEYSRRNGYFNLLTNFSVLHQSWAREPEEVRTKLHNWGHSNDLSQDSYFQLWNTVTEANYGGFTNLHPLYPQKWPSLAFVKGTDISEVAANFKEMHFPRLSSWNLMMQNSKLISRLRKLFQGGYGN
jgi:hypothetical protein